MRARRMSLMGRGRGAISAISEGSGGVSSSLRFAPFEASGRSIGARLLYCATVLATIDYRWWVFIHLAGVFGFLLAHGASVSALFRLRKERDREKIRQLIQFSGSTIRLFYISLLVLVVGGVGAGLQAHWF